MLRILAALLWVSVVADLLAAGGWYYLKQRHKSLLDEVEAKTAQVEEMQKVQREWKKLQKESEEMKRALAQLEQRIPEHQDDSYQVIRDLAVLILKHPVTVSGFKHAGQKKQGAQAGGSAEGESEDEAPSQAGQAASGNGTTKKDATPQVTVKPIPVTVTMSAPFPAVLDVVDDILNQQRLFLIKSLKIERDARIVPHQKVEMTVETYSFE